MRLGLIGWQPHMTFDSTYTAEEKQTPIRKPMAKRQEVLRPSSYPLLVPKYPLLGTIYPQLRVQGRSWYFGLNLHTHLPCGYLHKMKGLGFSV